MNSKDAFEQIELLIKKSGGERAKKLSILYKTLKEIAGNKIEVRAEIGDYDGLKLYLNGKLAKIRAASVNGGKSEHQRGYERFRIRPLRNKVSFVVFAIEHLDKLRIYVFRANEIENVKSLNLRISDESPYKITRKSKYDAALRNWDILKGD
ncbi:MAG: hypothetical protein WA584_02370 [Pyrinomonadaceae bacterium]